MPIGLAARVSSSHWHLCDAPLCEACTYEVWNTLTGDDTWDECPWHAHREGHRPDMRTVITSQQADELRADIHRQNGRARPLLRLVK